MFRIIIEKKRKIKGYMSEYIKEELSIAQKIFIVLDLFLCIIIHGSGINDYFQYEFYKLNYIGKRKFIVYRKRMKIVRFFNDKHERNLLDNKTLFNEKFSKFVNRDWLYTKNMVFEEFEIFSSKHEKFVFKPSMGSHGKGIEIISIEDRDLTLLYTELKSQDAVLEEIILQNEAIARFNASSVNSLRLVTLVPFEDKPRLMTANLRMGRGDKIADNFHHEGIASLIDINSGTVITQGIDAKGETFVFHPNSKEQIIGFKIPNWSKVVETVLDAATVLPNVRYIGWDVAIGKNNEVIIIEGNAAADPDITQITDKIGKWDLYKQYIKRR